MIGVVFIGLACQVIPTPPPLRSTPRISPSPPAVFPPATLTAAAPGAPGSPAPALTAIPGRLPEFPYQPGSAFAQVSITIGPDEPAATAGIELPISADRLANRRVIAGLTLRQQNQLLRTGFTLVRTNEDDFEAVRRRVTVCYGQPYYLTTDAAFHALDQVMDRLLPALEKEELHRRMLASAAAALDEILSYQALTSDERLAGDVRLAAAYLSVGVRLLDPQARIDPDLQPEVEAQVAQIDAGRGIENSTLIPGYRDDFRHYQPQGHYAADTTLRNYWRGRAWFSRAGFALDDDAGRAALVLTLALRRGMVDPQLFPTAGDLPRAAADLWADVYSTLRFIHGPGLDHGPAETAGLMDRVYSPGLTLVSLADADRWELIKVYARDLPVMEPGPLLESLRSSAGAPKGWRWMPIDLRLDDVVLNSLEGKRPPGLEGVRPLPSGLEMMAVLGSPAAEAALRAEISANMEYTAALEQVRERFNPFVTLTARPSGDWGEILWLQALHSRLQTGAEATDLQRFRALNSAFGGWIESRRAPGGSQVQSTASPQPVTAPAALEPAAGVYYHLARIALTLAQGLTDRGLTGVFSPNPEPGGLQAQIQETSDLGDRLRRLGDLAAQNRGQPADTDTTLITAALAPGDSASQDCRSTADVHSPLRGLVSLQAADGSVRYAGIGGVNRIYALVSENGEVYVAQGGVYSTFEFPEPRYGMLDDFGWRRMISFGLIEPPGWDSSLYLPDGSPVDVLMFRLGYRYRVLPAAGRLLLRAEPGRAAQIVERLAPGARFTIVGGPERSEGFTWWQVGVETEDADPPLGWLIEDPAWYALENQ